MRAAALCSSVACCFRRRASARALWPRTLACTCAALAFMSASSTASTTALYAASAASTLLSSSGALSGWLSTESDADPTGGGTSPASWRVLRVVGVGLAAAATRRASRPPRSSYASRGSRAWIRLASRHAASRSMCCCSLSSSTAPRWQSTYAPSTALIWLRRECSSAARAERVAQHQRSSDVDSVRYSSCSRLRSPPPAMMAVRHESEVDASMLNSCTAARWTSNATCATCRMRMPMRECAPPACRARRGASCSLP